MRAAHFRIMLVVLMNRRELIEFELTARPFYPRRIFTSCRVSSGLTATLAKG